MSAIDVCFGLLEEMMGLVLAPNVKSKSSEESVRDLPALLLATPDALLTTVFGSSLVQTIFSIPSHTNTGGTARKQQRKRTRSGSGREVRSVSVGAVYLERMGRLLSTALRCSEDFKKSDGFLDLFQRLLSRIQNCRECNTDISRWLGGEGREGGGGEEGGGYINIQGLGCELLMLYVFYTHFLQLALCWVCSKLQDHIWVHPLFILPSSAFFPLSPLLPLHFSHKSSSHYSPLTPH